MASESQESADSPPENESPEASTSPLKKDGSPRARKGSTKKGAPKKGQQSVTQPQREPVFSGRLIYVMALFVAMLFVPLSPLGSLITRKAPTATQSRDWKVGAEGVVHVTVVTADYERLACAHPDALGKYHCAYSEEKKPWPRELEAPLDDNKKYIIQPYRTVDGSLLLLPGLWAQPVVATRLHNEPPQGVDEKKLSRFVVECKVKFLAEWPETLVRWAPGQAYSRQGNGEGDKPKVAPVAEPQSCRILERKRTT